MTRRPSHLVRLTSEVPLQKWNTKRVKIHILFNKIQQRRFLLSVRLLFFDRLEDNDECDRVFDRCFQQFFDSPRAFQIIS